MINPFHQMPRGPGFAKDLAARVDALEDEVQALQPQPSPTVRPSKTATGTTYEAAAPSQAQESTNRQVWL